MNIRKRGNDSQLRWGRGSSRGLWWGSKAQALDSYRFVRNSLLWFLFHGLGPHSQVLVQSAPSSAQQRAPCPLTVLRRHTSSVPQTVHANKVLCYQLLNNKNKKRTEFSPCLRFPCVHLLLPIRPLFVSYQFFLGQTTSHLPVFTVQANRFHWLPHAANHQPHKPDILLPWPLPSNLLFYLEPFSLRSYW